MEATARTGPASTEEWQQVMQARRAAESFRSQLDHWQSTVAFLSQKLQLQLAQNAVLAEQNAAHRMEANGAGLAPGTALGGSSATKDADFAARLERISASLRAAVSEHVATPDEPPSRPLQPSIGVPSSLAIPCQAAPAAMVSSMSTEHGAPEVPTPQAAAAAMDTWTWSEIPDVALQSAAPKFSSIEKKQVPAEESMAPSREPLQMSFGSCNHAKAEPCMVPRAAAGTVARAFPLPSRVSSTPDASDGQEGATWRRPGASTVGNKCNQPQNHVELAEEHKPACLADPFVQGLGSSSAAPQDMALAEHPKELAAQQTSSAQMPGRTLGSNRPLRTLKPHVTTLAVRNIPARYSQQRLLGEWPPDGTYDLLHLPYNPGEKKTLGYAFINFASHALALEFQQRWHGKFLSEHGRTRALDIASASIQGYWLNLQRLRSRGMDSTGDRDHLPATFSGMTRLDTQQELQKLACMQ